MTLITAIILGISGTALMTLFMYCMSYITHRPVKVVKVLGTMLTFQTTPEKGLSNSTFAILTGIIAHYLVGILFALPFILLCNKGWLSPSLLQFSLFGLICGLFGIIVWRIFFAIHPNPPAIPLRHYLTDLVIAHLIFGLGMWIPYKLIEYWMIS